MAGVSTPAMATNGVGARGTSAYFAFGSTGVMP
jgi:hypothetical protein